MCSSDLTLEWQVSGFTIDADALANGDTTPVAGRGHVHVQVDGTYYDATAEESYTITGLSSGVHTLSVELAGNDHVESGVSDSVDMTIYVPTVAITSPASGTTLDGCSAELALTFSDFAISQDVGGAAVVGEGHWHILVDGVYQDYGTDTSRAIATNLSAGTHDVTVELVSSDHTSLTPNPVTSTVSVTVPSDASCITIDQSGYGDALNSASVPVDAAVANFTLDPDNVGGSASAGEGHIHLYLDGVYVDYTAAASSWLYHVAEGDHVLETRLADNDHTEGYAIDYARFSVAAGRPDITLDSPLDGEVVTSDSFYVTSTAENFSLVDPSSSSTNVDGEGHYHIYVDGVYLTYDYTGSTIVSGLNSGDHTLQLELVNNDHTSLADPVWSEEITVTLEIGRAHV